MPGSARRTAIIFGGFSADAVADRNNDAKARLIITADGGWRRGKVVPLKQNVDAGLDKSPTVEKCIVFNRCNQPVDMKPGRDFWWHELMADASADCARRAARQRASALHPLHQRLDRQTQGRAAHHGRLPARHVADHRWVFDLKEDDTYWCTADIGWVTGHSYIVYGPLANGATTVMYEGAPQLPDEDRFW